MMTDVCGRQLCVDSMCCVCDVARGSADHSNEAELATHVVRTNSTNTARVLV